MGRLYLVSLLAFLSLSSTAAHIKSSYPPKVSPTDIMDLLHLEWLKSDEEVIKLIEQGIYDRTLNDALNIAAGSKREPCVLAALIKRGANVNHANANGCFPLHRAAFARNAKNVRFLLNIGADSLSQQKNGWFPLNNTVWLGISHIPHWVINREKQIIDRIENIKEIVKMLIVEGGNDPAYTYKRERFSEKSAYSDCKNDEVFQAMNEANEIRLKNLEFYLHQRQGRSFLDGATKTVEEKGKALIEKYNNFVQEQPSKSANYKEYDAAMHLAQQLSPLDIYQEDLGMFSEINIRFIPIKVATFCFSLVLTKSPQVSHNFSHHGRLVVDFYAFEVRDWSHQHVLLKGVLADEMQEVFNYLITIHEKRH